MKVDHKAFLAIDSTMAAIIHAAFEPYAKRIMHQLEPLLEQGKWQAAQDIAEKIDLSGFVTAVKERLHEVAVSALLFGAHKVHGDLDKVSYVQNTKAIPHEVTFAIEQMEHAIGQDGSAILRTMVHNLIREQHADPGTASRPSMFKAEFMAPPPESAPGIGKAMFETFDSVLPTVAQRIAYQPPKHPDDCGCLGDATQLIARFRKAIRKDASYASKLNDAVLNGGKALIDIGATMTTSRLVSLGFLSEAKSTGVVTYKISEVLDGKTCPVCKLMDGKTFTVSQQFAKTLQQLGESDPAALKTLAPWPKQDAATIADLGSMTNDDLQAMGLGAPPFHPYCRGTLEMVDTDMDQGDPTAFDQAVQDISEGAAADAPFAGAPEAKTPRPAAFDDLTIIQSADLRAAVAALDEDLQGEIVQAYEDGDIDLLKSLLDDAGIAYTQDQLTPNA